MNYTHLIVVLMMLSIQATAQNTHFISEGATGTGASWNDASGDLQSILKSARYGDEIWIAKGTYFPTHTTDRNISFDIPSGVRVFGGFAGNEIQLDQRNWELNKTILSGNIGTTGSEDNSYNVVYTKHVDEKTIIDGLEIADGSANGIGPVGDRTRCGGGWFNDARFGTSDPVIKNCLFTKNEARDGAALYNYAENGNGNMVLENCTFVANKADLDGGALYNDGRNKGVCNPLLTNCTFLQNKANYGGALFNYGGEGQSNPELVNCTIQNNLAYVRGGAMLNMDLNGESTASLEQCIIQGNEASVGKGVYQLSAVFGRTMTIESFSQKLKP